MYDNDKRVVVTLDAGGTNFVFGAMQANEFVVDPLAMPAFNHDLDKCLESMVDGFSQIMAQLRSKPVAISFAFPGPADYKNGIIGGYLPNFPCFREGVALSAFLEDRFDMPVFINNDADLFACGEALAGRLPQINSRIKAAGSTRQFNNLLGYTIGTGFGFGFVSNNSLHIGDNSCVETFCLRNKLFPELIVEEGVSVRGLKRSYARLSGHTGHSYEPKDIFEIAEGSIPGDKMAAIGAFAELGRIAGDAIATAVSLIDGIVVLGGGITSARKYFMPALLEEMRSSIATFGNEPVRRVQMAVYDLDNNGEFEMFARGEQRLLKVHGSEKEVVYDPQKRVGVTISKLGASKAISIGAYNYALSMIDKNLVSRFQLNT